MVDSLKLTRVARTRLGFQSVHEQSTCSSLVLSVVCGRYVAVEAMYANQPPDLVLAGSIGVSFITLGMSLATLGRAPGGLWRGTFFLFVVIQVSTQHPPRARCAVHVHIEPHACAAQSAVRVFTLCGMIAYMLEHVGVWANAVLVLGSLAACVVAMWLRGHTLDRVNT